MNPILLNLKQIIIKHSEQITGIIHVGAHKVEEYDIYQQCGITNVIWIEANDSLIPTIKRKVGDQQVINAVISNKEEIVEFNVMSLSGSSSILKPHLNMTWRKDLHLVKTVRKQAYPLKKFQQDQNFLKLDVQGAELKVLQGANLDLIDYIFTEVHNVETYYDCPLVQDIDHFLNKFSRVETKWIKNRHGDLIWGDALYVRQV